MGIKDIDVEYDCLRFKVLPGDAMLFFSDALLETPGADGKPWSVDRIGELFQSAPDGSAKEIIGHVMAVAMPPEREAKISDDLTVICIRRK